MLNFTEEFDTECPRCTYELNSCAAINEKTENFVVETKAKPNDTSICPRCRAILIFDKDMKLRLATYNQMEEILNDLIRNMVSKAMKRDLEKVPSDPLRMN